MTNTVGMAFLRKYAIYLFGITALVLFCITPFVAKGSPADVDFNEVYYVMPEYHFLYTAAFFFLVPFLAYFILVQLKRKVIRNVVLVHYACFMFYLVVQVAYPHIAQAAPVRSEEDARAVLLLLNILMIISLGSFLVGISIFLVNIIIAVVKKSDANDHSPV